MFLDQMPKLAKGFIRLGHDVRLFSYCSVLSQLSPLASKGFAARFYKSRVDKILAGQVKSYKPHVVYVSFARSLDERSVELMREAAPGTIFVGGDGDPWPKLQKDRRIETAKKLDILTATNDGQFLQDYRDAGVSQCVFMPNMCDPDTDRHYVVDDKWKTDVLWTGSIRHDPRRYPAENMRFEIIQRLAKMPNCSLYGCCGRPQIGGIDYFYAISGAKIGLCINADNTVRLYHSDRLTNYLASGVFVLAKRVPDSDLLFEDARHLRYFDSVEHFFELAEWYLSHETERKRIADAGMERAHKEFNCVKIAGYLLDIIENGICDAPWNYVV